MKHSHFMRRGVMALMCMGSLASLARASESHSALFTRDASYEEYLHVQANPDEKITPARVLRWMMGFRGQALTPPTATEFQPIVDANNHCKRFVAAVTYKFF